MYNWKSYYYFVKFFIKELIEHVTTTGTEEESRWSLRRNRKKVEAADKWACRVEELTELRELIPIKHKERILKYIGRLKK